MGKTIKIYAYTIENTDISRPESNFSELFVKKLKDATKIKQRCYEINSETHESDVLSMFQIKGEKTVFGALMRVVPSKEVPSLPSNFLDMDKLDYSALEGVDETESKMSCKHHDYFEFDATHLVTTMSSSRISQLKAFANFFLEAERGDKVFRFTSMVEVPEGTKLKDISSISFGGTHAAPIEPKENVSIGTKIMNMATERLKDFLDDSDISFLVDKNVLTANLVIKFNSRSKKVMDDESVKKAMGAVITNIASDEEVVFTTKDKRRITAGETKRSKIVEIDTADHDLPNEQDLKAEMYNYLKEIKPTKR